MTPGLWRRLAAMLYEAILLFAVAFFAGSVFLFASGGAPALTPVQRALQGLFVLAFFALYFLWAWLRGGQTLAMKAWRIRLVDVTPGRAVARFFWALLFVPTGVSVLWAVFDMDRQFLHDRLARTRLVRV